MSKLNKRMVMRRIVSKSIHKIITVCTIATLMTTLATTANSNEQPENKVIENTEVEEDRERTLVAGASAILSEALSLDEVEVVENEIVVVTSAPDVSNDYSTDIETENESDEDNDVQEEETEVEIVNNESTTEENIENEENIIDEEEEETIIEEEEEIITTISEYWPVTEDQLTAYFGYVPEEWELAYWEATVMAECGWEPDEGIKAVADCIGYIRTNTDDRFPDTIYGVITQKNQFSTWSNGSIDKWLGDVCDNVHTICVNQIQNGASYNAAFFTAGGYNKYCVPGFVIGNHYFGY